MLTLAMLGPPSRSKSAHLVRSNGSNMTASHQDGRRVDHGFQSAWCGESGSAADRQLAESRPDRDEAPAIALQAR